MPMWRTSLLLKYGKQGCSENYWIDADDIDALETFVAGLFNVRKAMLNDSAFIQGVRFQEYGNRGLPSGRQKSVNKEKELIKGPPASPPDQITTSLLVRCWDLEDKTTKVNWLRFLPDSMISLDLDGNIIVNTALQTAFDAYAAGIIGGRYWMREFDDSKTSNPDNSWIDRIDLSAEGFVSVVLHDQIAAAIPGTRVKIKGYKGEFGKGMNGLADVLGIAGNTLYLNKKHCSFKSDTSDGGGAWCFLEDYTFNVINKCVIDAASSHDTGRPFFARRGRRGKQKRCAFTRVIAP